MKKMYVFLLAAVSTASTLLSCEKEVPVANNTVQESSNAKAVTGLTPNYVYTLAGNSFYLVQKDGIGDQAVFAFLGQMVADDGYLYALDEPLLRKVNISERAVTTLAGSGWGQSQDGLGKQATFSSPSAIALGPDGNLYVAEWGKVRKVTKEGRVTTVEVKAPGGFGNGPTQTAPLRRLISIAACEDGAIYVIDDQSVFPGIDFQIRKISREGVLTTLTKGPVGTPSSPWNIKSLAVLNKIIYAAGTGIYKISSKGTVTTVKKDITVNYNSLLPQADGSFLIASDNQIKKVSPNGTVSVVAGVPVQDKYAAPTEGPADSVDLHNPSGIALYKNVLYITVHPVVGLPGSDEYAQSSVIQMMALPK
jgi:hypothetical protein